MLINYYSCYYNFYCFISNISISYCRNYIVTVLYIYCETETGKKILSYSFLIIHSHFIIEHHKPVSQQSYLK
jgi:hypothetical protein